MKHQGTRINIGTKLLLSFLLLISVGIGALYIAGQGLTSYQNSSADFTNRFQRILLVQDIELYSRRYEVVLSRFITSPEQTRQHLSQIEQYNSSTENVVSQLRQIDGSAETRR